MPSLVNESCDQGVLFKKAKRNYEVHSNGRVISCTLSARLLKELEYPIASPTSVRHRVRNVKQLDQGDPVAIGDHVRYLEVPGGAMIIDILPRRTQLARRSAVPMPGARPFEQVFVANLDQVIPVFSAANPEPKWNMLDRYLVTAESAGLPSLICITKMDLLENSNGGDDSALHEALDDYRRIGYPVILTSAANETGLDELTSALRGRSSVLLGKSGVGKSTLLNAIEPGLGLRVNQVNQVTGKGRHTTTHFEMFPLAIGGAIIDTPGVREFGLWDVHPDDLAGFFPEMRPYVGTCKFGLDCSHDEEPGCEIRKAVMGGVVNPRRYQSYLRLRSEV